MSDTGSVVDDTTNSYALTIDLTSKSGLSLFNAATKGLPNDKQLNFEIALAATFKQEID